MLDTHRIYLPFTFALLLILSACGGGGGSDDGGSGASPTPEETSTVSVFLTKAPVNGATCNLHDTNDQVVAGPVNSTAGVIEFAAVSYTGDVYTQCSGGSYVDEATGSTVQLAAQHIMRSVTNPIGGSSSTVNQIVTPLTEIAHRLARESGDLSSANMAILAAEVADNFGLDNVDITQIQPTPLNAISGNTSDSDLYGIALAAISQMQEDAKVAQASPTGDELLSLITEIETGLNTTGFDSATYIQSLINLTSNSNTQSVITDITPIISLAPNVEPTLNAGEDQTVASTATFTLNGSGSDIDGTISSYSWSEVGGSSFIFPSIGNPSLSFIAPRVLVDTTYTFQLTVTDNDGATASDVVAVTVLAGQYTVGVTVTGLDGSIVLQNNESEEISANTNGTYTFNSTYSWNSTYSVTIKSNPSNLLCEVSNASGFVRIDLTLGVHCVSKLNKLGELASGNPNKIEIKDGYAYLGTSHGLYTVNISNPGNITPVGYAGDLGQVNSLFNSSGKLEIVDMVISGNYLYAATNGFIRMIVLDISDPSTPSLVNTQYRDAEGWASSITVSGNYVYVLADGFRHLGNVNKVTIYDVSTPDIPVVVGQLPGYVGDRFGDVAAKGDYVYYAADVAGLIIVDKSNPAEPIQVARKNMSELNNQNNFMCDSVMVSGQHLYLSCDKDLFLFDVSDPTNPMQVGLYENVGPSAVAINDSSAYFISGRYIQGPDGSLEAEYLLNVADISTSAVPEFIVSTTTTTLYTDIAFSGSTMFITHASDGISALDISNPINPVQIGSYNTPADVTDITVSGDLLYVADRSSGLNVVDATNIASPQKVGSFYSGEVRNNIKLMGNYAYSTNRGKFNIFDISTPQSPMLQSQYSYYYLTLFDIEGDYAYTFIENRDELIIIDVSDPIAPVMTGSLTLPFANYNIRDIKHSNGLVYVSMYIVSMNFYGIMIFDVSDPGIPVHIGSYNPGRDDLLNPIAMDIQGQFAYICDQRLGNVIIVDISNSVSPQLVGNILATCSDIVISGNSAYLSTEDAIRVFDVSDVNNTVEVARYNGPEMSRPKISIVNNKIYAAQQGHGVVIIDAFVQ